MIEALVVIQLNPFHTTDIFQHPLKTFLDVFRGYRKSPVTFIYLFIFNLFNVDKLTYIFDIWR